MRLKDKVCAITGAGNGIGRAAAELFGREGAEVVILERNEAWGRQVQAVIKAAGGRARCVALDISQPDQVQQAFATIRKDCGRLDVLYNNASIFLGNADGPVDKVLPETWQTVLAVNLNGLFYCCKYALPVMIAGGGGSIINTASSAAINGIPGCDAYTASKGATVALTRSMAVEYGPRGVRVNCIAPAAIATPMLKESNQNDPDFDEPAFFRAAPLGRYGTPEEVARIALFLASDESAYLNGAIIPADGGVTVTSFVPQMRKSFWKG